MLQNYSGWKSDYFEYILILIIAGFLIYSIPSFMDNTLIGTFCIEVINLIKEFSLEFPFISSALLLLVILLDSKHNFCLLKGLKTYFCQKRFNKYVDCSTISTLIVLLLKQQWKLFVTSFILYLTWCLFRILRKAKDEHIPKEDENIDTDEPIKSKDKDFLGRGIFAEEISEKIRCINSNNSLIVGLYGEWGSGKSSFLKVV